MYNRIIVKHQMYQLLTNDTYQGVERILNFYDPFRLLNDGLLYLFITLLSCQSH